MSKKQNNNIEVCYWQITDDETETVWETECGDTWHSDDDNYPIDEDFQICTGCNKQVSRNYNFQEN